MVIDDPDEVLPAALPAADLLVSLHESPGAAELIPDIAQRSGAAAVLAAVDDRSVCPRGLENQVGKRLKAIGVAFAFARPLCGFDGGPHPLLSAFAERFGRPKMRIAADGDRVGAVTVNGTARAARDASWRRSCREPGCRRRRTPARCGTTTTHAWRPWRWTRSCPTR